MEPTLTWYGLITRDVAYDTNQYISIDGSTKNGFYGASFNYKSANGLDIVSGREEFGGRFLWNSVYWRIAYNSTVR